jgi:AbrB family looped-hinge helix DNA binding protein
MKVGERGQVTIPRHIREKFGIDSNTRVEFDVVNGSIILKKTPVRLGIHKWRGMCAKSFSEQGYSPTGKSSVDKFINDIRGRL